MFCSSNHFLYYICVFRTLEREPGFVGNTLEAPFCLTTYHIDILIYILTLSGNCRELFFSTVFIKSIFVIVSLLKKIKLSHISESRPQENHPPLSKALFIYLLFRYLYYVSMNIYLHHSTVQHY